MPVGSMSEVHEGNSCASLLLRLCVLCGFAISEVHKCIKPWKWHDAKNIVYYMDHVSIADTPRQPC